MIGTKWKHKTGNISGKVVEHNPKNGRVVLRLKDGKKYRGLIGNLKDKWEQTDG